MALYRFEHRVPKVGAGSWVSDSARVIGDVVIGEDCYIGHGAILRGDYGSIRIGDGTAVEENAVIHIHPEGVSTIGKHVTIGHGATVHCGRIDDFAVIGMGAVLSFEARIGSWAIVAEGCVVPRGMEIPPEKVATGVPATVVQDLQPHHKEFWIFGKELYVKLAHKYPKEFERIG